MTEPVGAEWLKETVRIGATDIHFGAYKLPGIIAEGGVTVRPGGASGINTLTVDFIVGEVITEASE